MRRFIIKIIMVIIPVIFIAIGLEFCLINEDNSYYALKKKALVKQKASCKLLILGSSAENSGINPAYFDSKGLNLAFVGGTSLDVFYLLILRYVAEMPKLEKVIIPISTFTLFATEEREDMKFRKILLNKYFQLYENDFNNPWFSSLLFNIGFKKSIKLLLNRQSNYIDDYGFDNSYGSISGSLTADQGKKTVIRHIGKKSDDLKGEIFKDNIELLNSIIDYLKMKNIKVYLITSPTHVSYHSNVSNEILEIIHKEITKVTPNYNIKYFDHLKDNRFDNLDFYNCDHLNVNGAKKFSELCNKELLD